MKKKLEIKIGIVVLLFFSITLSVYAAEIIFQTPTQALGVGDEFSVPIVLSSPSESVNAVSGDIVFSDDTLSVENILSANSVVTEWIDPPHSNGNSVVFSGIMPGGYETTVDPVTQGRLPGIIATIVFKVKAAGAGNIQFSDAHAYKNDGLGSEASIQTHVANFSLGDVGSGILIKTYDTNPPLAFTPIISHYLSLYDGRWFVVFGTTDKETGIDHYEVKEGSGDWVRADSPYVLNDQTLSGAVSVKAVDLAGNFTIGVANKEKSFSKSLLIIPVVFLLLVIFFVFHKLYVGYHKKKFRL